MLRGSKFAPKCCLSTTRARLQVAEALLAAGADLNRATNGGRTPLHRAASRGHLDLAKLLCSHGAARDGTEAQWATAHGHPELAAWLAAPPAPYRGDATGLRLHTLAPGQLARPLRRTGVPSSSGCRPQPPTPERC